MKRAGMILLTLISLIGMASIAQAHMLWLNVSNNFPELGETVTIEIGWGHKFPSDEMVQEDSIENIFVRNPEGLKLLVEKVAPAKYNFAPKSVGEYEIIANLRPRFVSNTPDGRKMGSKKTLSNVVSCINVTMNAKALIKVGSKDSSISHQSNLPIEIILPENFKKFKAGDELALKVMYQDMPLSNVKLSATDENTAQQQEGKWVQESETDEQGMARIKLFSKGHWLFTASHEIPYKDLSECDKSLFRTTLTLTVE